MKILVINSGSSSLKYQLIDMDGELVLCRGLCERIGTEGGSVTHHAHGQSSTQEMALPTHAEAFTAMVRLMSEGEGAVVAGKGDIDAVGHRVVHGGEQFTQSVLATHEVLTEIDRLAQLAPLHNPPQAAGIRSARAVFGDAVPQVCVFDTAFHQTMPPMAYMYAIPYRYYQQQGVRRYGFHGTSHRYVSARAAAHLGRPIGELKLITCHLGNGSSITAVQGGKSVDTSMGLTPLGGIMMGTRAGDLDPGVVTFLQQANGMDAAEVNDVLNKESGFLGVSGLSADNRDIAAAAAQNPRAALVQEMLAYQIKKFIGAYTAAMGGLDGLVFTGGIGENSAEVRAAVCEGLGALGIGADPEKNRQKGEVVDITAAGATVKVLVVQTNEELMIARDTLALVQAGAQGKG